MRSGTSALAAVTCALLGAGLPIVDGVAFEDITEAAGLASWSTHYGDPTNKRVILESIGGGIALVDLDADGHTDIYVPTGQATLAGTGNVNALFRGTGHGRFTSVPASFAAGIGGWSYGVAVADYDSDGFLDLYVTRFGSNALLRNRGDGSYENVAHHAGVELSGFSTGAAWADFDLDGSLDLAVTNYVVVDLDDPPLPGSRPTCRWKQIAVACGPRGLQYEGAVLLRNLGDGRFSPHQPELFGRAEFYGLGLAWHDYDDDGDPDLYVANDQTPNRLLRNEGGRFSDIGVVSGTAYSEDGRAEAGMGTDWGDTNADGRSDLFVTNFADESNTLYRGLAAELFQDQTSAAGLAVPSFRYVGWGTGFQDFDSDGDLDLLVANGHVYPEVDEHALTDRYRQRDQLFLNERGRYREWIPADTDPLAQPTAARGLAFGDADEDGDVDALLANIDGPPRLLANALPQGNLLKVRLTDRGPNRHAVGARVRLEATGLLPQTREIRAGHSYLSQSSYELHFGLGSATEATLRVWWPGDPGPEPGWSVSSGTLIRIVRGREPAIRPLTASHGSGTREQNPTAQSPPEQSPREQSR